jgi:hypothetical protein
LHIVSEFGQRSSRVSGPRSTDVRGHNIAAAAAAAAAAELRIKYRSVPDGVRQPREMPYRMPPHTPYPDPLPRTPYTRDRPADRPATTDRRSTAEKVRENPPDVEYRWNGL